MSSNPDSFVGLKCQSLQSDLLRCYKSLKAHGLRDSATTKHLKLLISPDDFKLCSKCLTHLVKTPAHTLEKRNECSNSTAEAQTTSVSKSKKHGESLNLEPSLSMAKKEFVKIENSAERALPIVKVKQEHVTLPPIVNDNSTFNGKWTNLSSVSSPQPEETLGVASKKDKSKESILRKKKKHNRKRRRERIRKQAALMKCTIQKFRETQDQAYIELRRQIEDAPSEYPKFRLTDGIIYRRGRRKMRVPIAIAPNDCIRDVLKNCHDDIGHVDTYIGFRRLVHTVAINRPFKTLKKYIRDCGCDAN